MKKLIINAGSYLRVVLPLPKGYIHVQISLILILGPEFIKYSHAQLSGA